MDWFDIINMHDNTVEDIYEHIAMQKAQEPIIKISRIIPPKVTDVTTYNNRVVKVTFADRTFTKAVCSEEDVFNLDTGITICLLKKILGTSSEEATKDYNKLMRQIHKTMEKNELEKEKAKSEREARKLKERKEKLKRAAKKLQAKEDYINLTVEAIRRSKAIDPEDRREAIDA